MDGHRLWTTTSVHLFGTFTWNGKWNLAFYIYHNNVRHTLNDANAAREPYSRIIRGELK